MYTVRRSRALPPADQKSYTMIYIIIIIILWWIFIALTDDTSILHALPKYNNKLSNILLNSGSLTNNGSYYNILECCVCIVRPPLWAVYTRTVQFIIIIVYLCVYTAQEQYYYYNMDRANYDGLKNYKFGYIDAEKTVVYNK